MPVPLPTRLPLNSLSRRVARVAEMVATPLLPADYMDLINPLASSAELRGRIVSIIPETKDAATLVIEPGRGWRPHKPGQYIRLGIDVRGVRHWRAYSLTSPPGRADGRITITVKAIEDGLVSNFLVHEAKAGTVIQLDQACGEFAFDESPRTRLLFITAGSGITPVMGMLRSHIDQLEDVTLVHSAPTASEMIFRRELLALDLRENFNLIELHTDRDGMLDPADLGRLVPDYQARDIWGCGPTGLLDSLEAHLESVGLVDRLRTERFRPSIVIAGDGGTVEFTATALSAEADGATPILDVGEQAGVLMPSGCRMGICFGCVSTLREGAVRDLRNGDLTVAADGEEIQIQTCISAAAGNCQIER